MTGNQIQSRKQNRAGPTVNAPPESRSRVIWLICLAGMAFVLLHALRSLPQISDLLLGADGDDQMRLVQVRDWLAGQDWFDTRQYRILPPDGISMHWSRYVDAGIGAILSLARTVLSAPQAELATVIIWPSLLACLMVLVIVHGNARLMGPAGAMGALAVFLSWGKLGGEFVAPRIDHHNVQILCATALFYLSLVPGRSRLLGAMAGAITAMGLAVGLEMLPTLATIWGLMALRHAFGQPRTGDWLLGFGLAITVAAPLLMIGQTASSAWLTPYCDVLSTPVMALGAVGVVATLLPVLAGRVLQGAAPRILLLLAITALGLWLAWPLLGQCLAGPYSDVPPRVRAIIEGNVAEALSAPILWRTNPDLLARVLAPPVIIGLLALPVAWRLRGKLDAVQTTALMQAFVVLAVGLVFATIQIRAANLMTPAVPLLGGFLLQAFTRMPRGSALRVPAVILLVLALPTTVEKAAAWVVRPAAAKVETGAAIPASGPLSDCRTAAAMAEIASLPKSLLFSTMNLGPAIITFTPHSATSAGYHRSPEAYWNGVGAFESSASLRAALLKSGADYVVFCKEGTLERTSPLITALMAKDLPPWLTDMTANRQSVQVLQVDKTLLSRPDVAP